MPDLILTNARIHTMDAAQPTARSIAIRDNQILALGTMTPCDRLLPDAEVIDLHDRCVIPGLIDAHLHAEWTALGLKNIDAEAPTLDELLRRVEERVKITPKGTWIRGHGWNQNVLGRRLSDKSRSRSGGAGASGLSHGQERTCGVGQFTRAEDGRRHVEHANPIGGEIVRDAHGEPTGIFFEGAMELISKIIPEPSAQQVAEAMRDALPLFHRVGLDGRA